MKNIIRMVKEVEHIDSMMCDKCGKMFDKSVIDQANRVEHIETNYGYGSFLDSLYINFDVCDECLHQWLKSFKNSKVILKELDYGLY